MKTVTTALFCLVLCYRAAFSQEATRFDEFNDPLCEDYLSRIENAMVTAEKNPNTTVRILIYEGRERQWNAKKNRTDFVLPAFGQAEARIRSMKRRISMRNFSIERFEFVKAGYRDKISVEMWLVPPGAEPPKPTPTRERMTYRKGRPKGFCTWCC
jgi:hypothetical protein